MSLKILIFRLSNVVVNFYLTYYLFYFWNLFILQLLLDWSNYKDATPLILTCFVSDRIYVFYVTKYFLFTYDVMETKWTIGVHWWLAVPIKRIRSIIKKQENEGRLLKKKKKETKKNVRRLLTCLKTLYFVAEVRPPCSKDKRWPICTKWSRK